MMKATLAAALLVSSAAVYAQFPPKLPDPTKVFTPPATNNLSVSITGGGNGVVTSLPPAITCPGPSCNSNFLASMTVGLAAVPAPDSIFMNWSGDCSGNGPCTVSMNARRNVTATFIKPRLNYNREGDGTGTVRSQPAGINGCGGNCSATFLPNTQVSLMADNGTGVFDGWTGNCGSSNPTSCSVSMTNHRNVGARFVRPLLKVSKTGAGQVTANGIACGSDCRESFNRGTQVTLTAVAAPGSGQILAGWSGACSGSAATCRVTMNAVEKNVNASFRQPLLKVSKSGRGAGRITSNPTGLSCTGNCTQNYPLNTGVSLTATAAGDDLFAGWSGDCTGSGACSLTMSRDFSVSAAFTQRFRLAVKKDGKGSVVSNVQGGINCGSDCTELHNAGAAVTIKAEVPAGGQFLRWEGACTGTSTSCTVAMSQERLVVAVFRQ